MTDQEAQLLIQLVQSQGREIEALTLRVAALEEAIDSLPDTDEGMSATHL